MPTRTFLGVDLGAESGRVMAGRFDGRAVALEELHRFSNGPVPVGGTLRWDVLRLWAEIRNGLQAAAKAGGEIVSVGVDTWGVDYVLLSKRDEILGQPYNYRDPRTRGLLAAACTQVPRAEIFAATGLQFMEINTLYQLLAARRDDPDLLASADRFLMMADWFHWCLCGSRVVEFTNATTTQCLHPARGTWAVDLLRKFGLPSGMFGEVVPPGTRLGTLREETASWSGLKRIAVVAPATHDTGAAVAAVPTTRTGRADWAYISSGTWSLMGVEVPHAVTTDLALRHNVTNEGGIDGTYRLLKNIMGLWLVQECRRSFERRGRALDYAELTRLATESPPLRSLVDPDDPRFLAPPDMPEAIAGYCRETGQPVPETEGQFVRCALESLALKYACVLTWLEELTGTPVGVVHVVGGGSRNELLNRFTAGACRVPVVAGPVEATVLGNVLIQARTAGELGSLSDLREVVRTSGGVRQFDPEGTAEWDAARDRFHELLARGKRGA